MSDVHACGDMAQGLRQITNGVGTQARRGKVAGFGQIFVRSTAEITMASLPFVLLRTMYEYYYPYM